MPNLDIIYEDTDLLVLNKPSGTVVNTSQTSPENTLQSILSERLDKDSQEDSEEGESEFEARAGIVHRLDKDTSGVLLVAKNEEAFKKLQVQFKKRTVVKEYVALIIGKFPDEIVEINAPIARHPHVRTKFAVVASGKEAMTKIEKIKEIAVDDEVLTLVSVFPKTGRTHQIRVHLTAFGNPVVGDSIYGSAKQLNQWGSKFPRLMLHACKIQIMHPTEGKELTFEAPLPTEFLAIQ